tara:strand:- start:253 stop:1383 length:1131 start_codon:yes stop_codon:yes gene_type:complete
MKVGKTILSVMALAAAPVLLLQGIAAAEIGPGPVNWNGFWQADISRAFLQVEESEGQISFTVPEEAVQLARKAWAKEPLASDALSVLATDLREAAEVQRLTALLDLASSIDKRNRFVGALQLELALQAEDIPRVFALIDRLSLTSPRLRSEFVAPLSALLGEEGGTPILRDALDARPVWANAFWNRVPDSAEGVSNMYELRRQTNVGTTDETDARLLVGLADNGFYRETLELWRSLEGNLNNPLAFIDSGALPPIGWRVLSTGERTFSPRGGGRYDIYVERQTAGELARQLVELEPGAYVFVADAAPIDEAKNLEVALECATDEDPGSVGKSLDEELRWQIGDTCEIYWLTVSASAWERARPLRATISNMVFKRDS